MAQPHDVLWSVARERLLLLGGPAALLLQVAHPLVAEAVAAHSDYHAEPAHRLLTTLQATLTVTFGDTTQARQAARRVGRRHATVTGAITHPVGGLPAGTPYSAADPDLALWVHATLVWTAMAVHDRYARPLPTAERDAYWRQAKPFARLFGVGDAALPPDWAGFVDYWQQAVDALQVTPAAHRIASDVLRPRLSPPLPGVAHLARAVTSDLLPAVIRDGYRLPCRRLHRTEARTLQAAVRFLRPHVPARYAYWPHYFQAVQRIAATTL
ncbi:oxygenase MpaB family protein [Geodermatophilus chilensis]|uniref:oxygenase MpaB family protein n=1 Tax=Geodermatophilus chilensis TaxID=2035835 RepID=UPI0012FFFBE2|nr:oxygenase MpaB family protein [Geodermatophilus chilensis]